MFFSTNGGTGGTVTVYATCPAGFSPATQGSALGISGTVSGPLYSFFVPFVRLAPIERPKRRLARFATLAGTSTTTRRLRSYTTRQVIARSAGRARTPTLLASCLSAVRVLTATLPDPTLAALACRESTCPTRGLPLHFTTRQRTAAIALLAGTLPIRRRMHTHTTLLTPAPRAKPGNTVRILQPRAPPASGRRTRRHLAKLPAPHAQEGILRTPITLPACLRRRAAWGSA